MSKKIVKKKSEIEPISVKNMDKELSKIVKKPIVAIQIGDTTIAYEVPNNPITDYLRSKSTKSRVVAELTDKVKIGIDFK